MVALDHGRLARAGLDHVGIDGSLSQEVDPADLFGLRFKDADEFFSDDLPFLLRFGYARQMREEALLRIHPDEVQIPAGKRGFHLISLILAHQAVIDKDAGQSLPDGFRQQGRRDGGIHPAGKRQQDSSVSDFLPYRVDGSLLEIGHGPVSGRSADFVQEVAQHPAAVFGMIDLRMKLHAVKLSVFVADSDRGADFGPRHQAEALRHLCHKVPVAHPGDALLRKSAEQSAAGVEECHGLSVLPGAVLLRRGHTAAQFLCQQLAAVTDPENRDAQGIDAGIRMGRMLRIDAVRPSGKDDPDGIISPDLLQRHRPWTHFAVHMAGSHPPGNQLVVLPAEIQNQDLLIIHPDIPPYL